MSAKNEEFNIELSEASLDMTNIYSYLTAQYREDLDHCPMIVVVKELPDRRTAIRLDGKKRTTRVILLREAAAPIMLSNLYEEITKPQPAEDFPVDCAFYYDSLDIYNLYVSALSIADTLKIACPQLIYTINMPAKKAGSLTVEDEKGMVNTLFLRQFKDFSRTLQALAYEMRHIWQHAKHEKLYYADYRELDPQAGEEAVHAFLMQKAEIDAEAFALRFLAHILNATVKAQKGFDDVDDAIDEKAARLALPF